MADQTEGIRRAMVEAINSEPEIRSQLEADYGQVWDTQQLQQDFKVLGFMAPFVVVERKLDGQKGCMMFQHRPRFYFDFQPD